MKRIVVLSALAASMIGTTGLAQSAGFDPRTPCSQVLATPIAADQQMIGAWAFGYLAARSDLIRGVNDQSVQALMANLQRACAATPDADLVSLMIANTKPAEAPPQVNAAAPGSEAEVRVLLQRFYDRGEDLNALTQSLFPTEAEVRMVYAEPLATLLWGDYKRQMTPGVTFGPKEHHNDLLVFYTTTASLAKGGPMLREFPGGYRKVLQYFKADVPIVRFKFVKSGETLGYAFDGLMYVNNRWVIMPKPWRSLPQN